MIRWSQSLGDGEEGDEDRVTYVPLLQGIDDDKDFLCKYFSNFLVFSSFCYNFMTNQAGRRRKW